MPVLTRNVRHEVTFTHNGEEVDLTWKEAQVGRFSENLEGHGRLPCSEIVRGEVSGDAEEPAEKGSVLL